MTMLKTQMVATVAAFLVWQSASAVSGSDCVKPDVPAIPDGSAASEEALVGARDKVMDFLSDGEEYRGCLDGIIADVRAEFEDAKDARKNALEEEYEALQQAYNEQVDTEKAVGDDFNAAIRAFKERSE